MAVLQPVVQTYLRNKRRAFAAKNRGSATAMQRVRALRVRACARAAGAARP